jgi:hypothetical protein
MKLLSVIVLLFLASFQTHAQKLKYKDIFPLISEKKYDEGEPLLRAYMNDKKNADDANATLQMAYLLEKYAIENRVVADSSQLYQNADSAIYFYQQALILITEKELSKNDEYYKEFYRRDLRTGEFGTKLSDVGLELNTRIIALKKRINNAKVINGELNKIVEAYNLLQSKYASLTNGFDTNNDFLLASGNPQIDDLKTLVELEYSIESSSAAITQAIIDINNAGFRMISKKMPIENISKDGRSKSNLYNGNFAMWNYADWAKKAIRVINDSAVPIREALISTLDRLEETSGILKSGTTIDFKSATSIAGAEKVTTLDPESVTLKYLRAKALELKYIHLSSIAYEPLLLDTGAVTFHQKHADSIFSVINKLKSVLNSINESEINERKNIYASFYEKLGGESGFVLKVNDMKAMADTKSKEAAASQIKWKEKSKWAIFTNDRLDLDTLYSSIQMPKLSLNGEFWPLTKTTDSLNRIFLVGITGTAANMQGFVAGVADSREGLWRSTFDIYKKKLSGEAWQITSKFVESASGFFTCYIFESNYSENKNCTIINFSTDGKVSWNVSLNIPVEPVVVKYNAILGETILFLVEENMIAQLVSGQKGYIVIDRNGNVR